MPHDAGVVRQAEQQNRIEGVDSGDGSKDAEEACEDCRHAGGAAVEEGTCREQLLQEALH